METKSRYEVIADLEKQKRILIRERDALDDETNLKQRNITILGRQKEDIAKQREDFELNQSNAMQDLKRKANDFNFKIKNTEDQIDREIVDADEDLTIYKDSIEQKKKTANELIQGVNESLERFGKLQSK